MRWKRSERGEAEQKQGLKQGQERKQEQEQDRREQQEGIEQEEGKTPRGEMSSEKVREQEVGRQIGGRTMWCAASAARSPFAPARTSPSAAA